MDRDYTVYNQHYQYMDRLLKQVTNLSKQMDLLYNRTTEGISASSDFFSVLKNAESNLGVPENMDDIFKEAAERYDVPLSLLRAMGKAESGFDADAVSSAGAMGVMQLMPATAKSLGVEDAFDARSNIMGGARYISEKLKKYDGNIELALAAYNAGSGNVAKYGGVPPFKETQNYIRRIKEYMAADVTADKTVYSRKKQDGGSGYSSYSGFDAKSALYMVDMMKIQMQNRMIMAGQSLLGREDSIL